MRPLAAIGYCLLACGYAWCLPFFLGAPWWILGSFVVGLAAAVLAVAWPTPGYVLVQALVFATSAITLLVESAGFAEWGVAFGVTAALALATALAAMGRARTAGVALVVAGAVNAVWVWTNGVDPHASIIAPANAFMTVGFAAAGVSSLAKR